MSVGKVAIFELHSTDADSDITVNVTRTYLPTVPKYSSVRSCFLPVLYYWFITS